MISIDKVLACFDDTYNELDQTVNSYSLRFITADGRVRTMHAKKKLKAPKQGLRKPLEARGKTNYNLQRLGNMLVEDMELQAPRTVKPATFFAFSKSTQSQPTHWETIYH